MSGVPAHAGKGSVFWKAGSGFKTHTSLKKSKRLAFEDEVSVDKEGSPQNHKGSVCRLAGRWGRLCPETGQGEGQRTSPLSCGFIPSTAQGRNPGAQGLLATSDTTPSM